MALKEIECAELGSEVGTKTLAYIRKHYRQEKAKESITEILKEINLHYEEYKNYLKIKVLSDENLENLAEDIETIKQLVQRKNNLEKLIDKFEEVVKEVENPAIKVLKTLWTDVVLAGPHTRHTVMEKHEGPLRIREDDKKGLIDIQRS
ncbi:MAG: DUF342 domain-containing protein [Fibrobacter sp.]|nr:DUF342 domain-containing protein [Fibrobacter sp.]